MKRFQTCLYRMPKLLEKNGTRQWKLLPITTRNRTSITFNKISPLMGAKNTPFSHSNPNSTRSYSDQTLRSGYLEIFSTPNPKSMQFRPMEPLLEGTKFDPQSTFNFSRPMEALKSPLGSRIFKIKRVENVMLANEYFSVTIDDEEHWNEVQVEIMSAFQEWTMSGEDAIDEDVQVHEDTAITEDDDEVVAAIKEVLETRVRPVVQSDGGDIIFREFTDEGVVLLSMTGSCKGCPSSAMTLKNGIENMLTMYVPEVVEVRQVETEEQAVGQEEFEKLEKKLAEGEKK